MPESAGQYRFTTIVVSAGDRNHRFRSWAEVPAPVRDQVQRATGSADSATILIADEAGERFLEQVLLNRLREGRVVPQESPAQSGRNLSWRLWAELAVCASAGLLIWFLAMLR